MPGGAPVSEESPKSCLSRSSAARTGRNNNIVAHTAGSCIFFSKRIGEKELHIAAELIKHECFFVTGYWT